MDLNDARLRRREMLQELRAQQVADSDCIREIKAAAVEGKRKLLRALADWLLQVQPGVRIHPEQRRVFASITSGFTVEEWQETQERERLIRKEPEEARADEKKARSEYDKVAPLGFVSGWFLDEDGKRTFRSSRIRLEDAKARRSSAEIEAAAARGRIAEQAERFLRDAVKAQTLELIAADPALSRVVLPILETTAGRTREIWAAHSARQRESIAKLARFADSLQGYYSTGSGDDGPAWKRLECGTRK
jgi:hypothetical protein